VRQLQGDVKGGCAPPSLGCSRNWEGSKGEEWCPLTAKNNFQQGLDALDILERGGGKGGVGRVACGTCSLGKRAAGVGWSLRIVPGYDPAGSSASYQPVFVYVGVCNYECGCVCVCRCVMCVSVILKVCEYVSIYVCVCVRFACVSACVWCICVCTSLWCARVLCVYACTCMPFLALLLCLQACH
jgi:hypothetical protein